jgi:Cdc25 family phosphatase
MTASSLSSILKASPTSSNVPRKNVAIVDVRDDDFEGGNIVGCINVPSTQLSEQRVQELVKELKDGECDTGSCLCLIHSHPSSSHATLPLVPTVVFHCSLSQQRGPKAARIYSEARQAALASSPVPALVGKTDTSGDEQQDTGAGGVQGGQEIYVLRDGFANFGQVYKVGSQIVGEQDPFSSSPGYNSPLSTFSGRRDISREVR